MPARMHDAGVLVTGEIIARITEDHPLFEAVHEHHAAARRARRRDEDSMITAGVAADEGGGTKAAQTVGLKPFFRQRRLEIGTGILVEGDHGFDSPTLRSP